MPSRIVAIREAWVYKDWQDAIGDMMLRRVEGEDRRFEVLGYSDFEQLCRSGDEMQKLRVSHLTDIFDAVDLSIEDRFDARPRQLRSLSLATARLVRALHSAQGSQTIVSKYVLNTADTIIESLEEEQP